jgi:hypothetical protein
MRKRKPIQPQTFIYFKYSHENVAAYKVNPEWYPKIGTMELVVGVEGDILQIQWKLKSTSRDDIWRIEQNRVQIKYGKRQKKVSE